MAKHVSVSDQMVDIFEPEHEIELVRSNDTIWINVDGKCRFRCTQIRPELIKMIDLRDVKHD